MGRRPQAAERERHGQDLGVACRQGVPPREVDNTKRCEQGTGNTPEAQALAKKMATAWANFARTGNPSQPGLTWEPTTPERCQTMVWDNHCRMEDDPEG